MINSEIARAIELIRVGIEKLALNLSGLTILTEVGTNAFALSPIIAAMSGAQKVIAYTSGSTYGNSADIIKNSNDLKKNFLPDAAIEFYTGEILPDHLEQADIITNSRSLRPLNEEKLTHCRSSAVIPVMFEKWELRECDIDIKYCTERGIKVAGTWEEHPDLQIFRFCGPLSVKLLFEAGYEVLENKILIWSRDKFGEIAAEFFNAIGASEVMIVNNEKDLINNCHESDVLFVADFSEKRHLSSEQIIPFPEIRRYNTKLGIVHLCGGIEFQYLKQLGFSVYPKKDGLPQQMTHTLAYLGYLPFILLFMAGLKVGESMLSNEISNIAQPINF